MKVVKVFLYDLTVDKDLVELERIKSNPQKYRLRLEETVTVAYRRIEYKILGLTGHPVKTYLYELNNPKDLAEMERIMTYTDKFQILVEETIILPYRHIEYEIIDPNNR